MKKNIKKLFISSAVLTSAALATTICITAKTNNENEKVVHNIENNNYQSLKSYNDLNSYSTSSNDSNSQVTNNNNSTEAKWYENKGWITVIALGGFVFILIIISIGIIFKTWIKNRKK